MKQEPRPAYHRRQDLKRLQEHAKDLPVLVTDEGPNKGFAVRLIVEPNVHLLLPAIVRQGLSGTLRDAEITARYEVVHAWISGARVFHALNNDGIPESPDTIP